MTNTINTNLESISINFASANRVESLNIADLPVETIDYLLQGGTRKFNDSINSKVADLKKQGVEYDINGLIDDLLVKIKSGDLSESRKADPDKAFIFHPDFLGRIQRVSAVFPLGHIMIITVKGRKLADTRDTGPGYLGFGSGFIRVGIRSRPEEHNRPDHQDIDDDDQ